MKKILAGAIVAAAFAAPAFAWEGQVVSCYDKVYMPPEFDTSLELIMAAHTEWEHVNGQMVQMHYPAVYREHRTMTKPGHYVARRAPCN